jgi:solute carrier family 25 (mitochondrial ornithine transporter) member 2/15
MSAFVVDTLSGLTGAILLVATGNPFEAAKLRLQTQQTLYKSPLDCLVKMAKNEGVRSLWKGAGPALLSSMIENSVLFAANGALRRLLVSTNLSDVASESSITPLQQGIIGGLSGIVSATAICPAEVVKCRLQYQHSDGEAGGRLYKGTAHAFSSIVRKEGFGALFSGLPALLARDVPFNFLFWGSYRGYCSLLHDLTTNHEDAALPSHDEIPGWMSLVAGSLAGGTAWAIVFPFDVLKSKAQVAGMTTDASSGGKGNLIAAFRNIIQTDPQGAKALYRGASAAITRGCVANGALFFGQNLATKAMIKTGILKSSSSSSD